MQTIKIALFLLLMTQVCWAIPNVNETELNCSCFGDDTKTCGDCFAYKTQSEQIDYYPEIPPKNADITVNGKPASIVVFGTGNTISYGNLTNQSIHIACPDGYKLEVETSDRIKERICKHKESFIYYFGGKILYSCLDLNLITDAELKCVKE